MLARDCYDVLVIGAGHAGAEAASAAARMGARTLLLTMDPATIAVMSCNPAIGGLAKGQIVREVDALGGIMGRVTDATGIQFRLLNRRKGPAVQSPRAQCDKRAYQLKVTETLQATPGLDIRRGIVTRILVESAPSSRPRVRGVACGGGEEYRARAVVLTPGTFLNAVLHIGDEITPGGRRGEPAAVGLSDCLRALGFPVGRLKTGTPPRISSRSVDYSRLAPQPGDDEPVPFSFSTDRIAQSQVPCHIAYTNARTHDIIRANLHRAPLYTGQITSLGPRYCPSIETKITRFAERERHQLFLEPEGLETDEVYVNGASTSFPRDVQEAMLRSVEGLESVEIVRYGYAVEYDYVPPTEVRPTLETKRVAGLFFAGQINGTSGYEEAAGQGLIAGINAVLSARGEESIVLGRDQAYIGVLIDDLVTKGIDEPYRMFTSRAEYRLLLRSDNADQRLMPLGRRLGLVDDAAWARFEDKTRQMDEIRRFLTDTAPGGESLEKRLRRPEVEMSHLVREHFGLAAFRRDALEEVETETKYAGYIARESVKAERMRRDEARRLPADADYDHMPELRFESREKLKCHRPETLAQAMRISGVNPADISVLMLYLKKGMPVLKTVSGRSS